MEEKEVQIGDIVIYKPIKATKDGAGKEIYPSEVPANSNDQDELPAIVVAKWSKDMVNLKVINDGPVNFWSTSRSMGDQAGQWHFK